MSKLTQQFVKTIADPGSYQDGRGLILRVSSAGAKAWIFRYQFERKRHDMSLGGYPANSLKDARLLADQQRMELSRGIDPLVKRHDKLHEEITKKKKASGFKAEALAFYRTHEPTWSQKHAAEWLGSMQRHVFPLIGSIRAESIGIDEVLSVLSPIWLTIPETARRVRNRVELVLDSAKAKGLRSGENPARWKGHLDKLLPRQPDNANPFESMPYDQIGVFVHKLDSIGSVAARACEMMIHTACRNSEVAGARWDEIDFQRRLWVIPADRMKAGREHRIPLTEAMLTILDGLKGSNSPYVFHSKRRNGCIPTNAIGRIMSGLCKDGYVPHGFRSSFRTWAAEMTNHSREVCEMALAHTIENKVEAAYNRGDLLDKRRILMEDWEQYILRSGPVSSYVDEGLSVRLKLVSDRDLGLDTPMEEPLRLAG